MEIFGGLLDLLFLKITFFKITDISDRMITIQQGFAAVRHTTLLSSRRLVRSLATLSLPSNRESRQANTTYVYCNVLSHRGIRSLGKVQGKTLHIKTEK